MAKYLLRFRGLLKSARFYFGLIAVAIVLQIVCYLGDRFIFGIAPIDSGLFFDNQGGGSGGRGSDSGLFNDSPTGGIILVGGIVYALYLLICLRGRRLRRDK